MSQFPPLQSALFLLSDIHSPLTSGKVEKVRMLVSNLLNAQRALAPCKLRVEISPFLGVLILQIEEEKDRGDCPDH